MNTTKVKALTSIKRNETLKEEVMKGLALSNKWLLAAILLCVAGAFIMPGSADALCAVSPEAGEWVDPTGNHTLAELNITIGCADQRLCPVGGSCYYVGGGINMSALGHCSPSNCDWGEAHETHEIGSWILGIYDNGWKMTWVWAKMSPSYPDKLFVKVYTDYKDGRRDHWKYGNFIRRDNSCIDSCDSKAPGGCWCDSLCRYYGDCCEDKVEQCGP